MNGQEAAIKKTKGPCVVLAGAGTGKTYTIVEKIKDLIKNKVYKPERIVCITFSNEAANNLLSRIQKALELEDGKSPVIKTFHAFSADLLRRHGEKIGIKSDFSILDSDEAKVMLHKYLKVSIGNCHKYVNAIGNAKDLGISMDSIGEYLDRKLQDAGEIDLQKKLDNLKFELKVLYLDKSQRVKKKELVAEIRKISGLLDLKKFLNTWNAYEKIKKIRNYQDYSDLNKNALHLLKENREISEDYDYIVVDEFQDTNKIQLDLLFCLAKNKNVTVVGDLNQSIYRFRGAYRKNFNEFKQVFNISKDDIFNLDKSYRSSNKILRAAYQLILNNYTKNSGNNINECFEVMSFNNREGENIEVYELNDEREESRKVLDLIENELKRGIDLRDICVMFRTHQQGRIIKKYLDFKEIPYLSVNKSSLLKEKSIKTVIDYLVILDKMNNRKGGGEQAWWDLIYQLGFRERDLVKIGRFIRKNRDTDNLSAVMLNSLQEVELSMSGKMAIKILIERIKRLIPFINVNVFELIKEIYNISGLINRQHTKEEKAVMMNMNKFYELAKTYSVLHDSSLSSFINYLDILDNLKVEISSADFESEGVRLMTLHATKGLEYKTVIITNMAQKRFPMETFSTTGLIPLELSPEFDFGDESMGKINENDLDYYIYEYERQNKIFEERRLCYVAFTRAREKLILTYANRYRNRLYYPSQFLNEISFKDNREISFLEDKEEKYEKLEFKGKSEVEFTTLLNKDNFDEVISGIAKDAEETEFNVKDLRFSPSSLLAFNECQKKYEYRYVYNMPEQKSIYWEALMLGSFIHRILDIGVQRQFKNLKEFEDLAKQVHMEPDWEVLDVSDALHLIRVFFARNKSKYDRESKTEQKLNMVIGGINFLGFADRIDFSSDGLEIIDYKTGQSNVPVTARNWQLGYYALAASKLGKVKRITLDMLRHDKPLEFELDDKGNAKAMNSIRMEGFNVYDVEQELIKAAHSVLNAYENGFKACSIEKNCEFCNEWVYGD